MMKNELARFGRGFVYAWNGILLAVREERNFRFHLCATLYVAVLTWLAELNATQCCLIVLCVAAMLGMELMNSAVERAVDKPDSPHWYSAGAAKDLAAGGVLAVAVGAVIVAILLFGQAEVRARLLQKFAVRPWILAAAAASLLPAYWFVFRSFPKHREPKHNDEKK